MTPSTADLSNCETVISFNGSLDQYLHVSPTKNENTRSETASPLKRKLNSATDEQSNPSSPTKRPSPSALPIPSPTRRTTRSQSTQALQTTLLTRPSPTKRTRSSKSTTPASPAPNGGPVCLLRDTIPPGLILLFIGVNPGIMTGQTGFVYAHPSNLYWKLLHSSGITARRHPPSDTYRLPELYGVGNTNIVARPTRDASMLSKAEMDAGVAILEEKVRKSRPEAVCLVGKSIWETFWRVRKGRNIKKEEFRYGWQDETENMGVIARGEGEDGEEWKGGRVERTGSVGEAKKG
ncbi:conserved hypothetical protein [Uncinocarpus reesii 1704]|uniref:Uracil-DNA glycosylase-like domain-containing protein n=1 Tax=Uncinocarpus reesii (strain UAMH 1704) TaxID=336963 RepID=C4JR12_UNCRE|nr:uncharacterized protein UREG_03494 [Uncinocarpus reesii 1704]EEP78648.1 conserved hypothetical protein [Uncinocarpus reesii 1704]